MNGKVWNVGDKERAMQSETSVIAGILLGQSAAIQRLRQHIAQVARREAPVLIEGPTGAGKELVARALHVVSERPGQLVAVNMSAVAPGIFEALMFGHVRGAFTGAVARLTGHLEAAHRGTLLLDEINALSSELQPKLLRAIETKRFTRLGECRETESNFRPVAATNVPLTELQRTGQVRRDLLYRLAGIVITVPSLQERRDDIGLLANYFLSSMRNAQTHSIAAAAVRVLERHPWPGNVRELRNVIERADACAEGSVITREDIERALGPAELAISRREAREEQVKQLCSALIKTGGNVTAAASLLGIHRATIYRRLARGAPTPTTSDRAPVVGDAPPAVHITP